MISRRLAIFGALFGLSGVANAQTRSATELPKCDYPDGMTLPSGGKVMSSDWSGTKEKYGRFMFGEFFLMYTPADVVQEIYVFDVDNVGNPQLRGLTLELKESLRKGWRDNDEASSVKLRSSLLPSPEGLDVNQLWGGSNGSSREVLLTDVYLRVVMAGPTDIVVGGPARMPNETQVSDYQHRLTSYEIVRRDARTVARNFMAAAREEQRGTCKSGGFDLDIKLCFLTTATVDTFGLPDDCWELTTLREFRDGPMQDQGEWQVLSDTYHAIAPAIVAAINARPDAPQIWAETYFTGILPSAILASLGLNRLAIKLYKNRVKALMQFTAPR